MRAVVMDDTGPPAVLTPREVPEPELGPGEALVEVELANITFVETQVRAGRPPHPSMALDLPAIPGNGVGGVVAAVGAGVDAELAGTRVITGTGGSGAYAERVAVPAGDLIEVPAALGLREAVALLADGRTAVGLMRSAEPQAGEVVLVEAAAGGVGSLLVQLARNAGARVVAAAGGRRKLDATAALGAEVFVDYGESDWPERVREELGGVDVAFDGVGGEVGRAAFELLRPGGRFVAFGMASGEFARVGEEEAAGNEVTVLRGTGLGPREVLEATREALAEAAAGRLRPVVGQTFPLEHAAAAHDAIESRATIGKTLLLVGPEGS